MQRSLLVAGETERILDKVQPLVSDDAAAVKAGVDLIGLYGGPVRPQFSCSELSCAQI